MNLGTLYGQTAHGIAHRLGVGLRQAERLLADHRALFPAFWRWSERIVQGSIDRGWIRTPCDWRSKAPFLSNERTWMNWPMQATGGDIMRLTDYVPGSTERPVLGAGPRRLPAVVSPAIR